MKLLRTKTWNWWDIAILKWCVLMFGIAAGAYFHRYLLPYLWLIIILAVILTIRPVIAYFRD